MTSHLSSPSNLTYRELRAAVLELLRAQRDGASDQRRLHQLLDEIDCRILDGYGLVRFLEELRRAELLV